MHHNMPLLTYKGQSAYLLIHHRVWADQNRGHGTSEPEIAALTASYACRPGTSRETGSVARTGITGRRVSNIKAEETNSRVDELMISRV